VPDWIQGDETPACAGCGRDMAFIAQIDSVDAARPEGGLFQFGDTGMIYIFYCLHCNHPEALMQSH
jgi:hypothetical protein